MRSYVVVIAVVAVIALVGAGLLWESQAARADPLPLRIGVMLSEASAPFHIADERGFFAENGLNVTIRPYESGDQAIAAVEAGEVEIGMTAEYPVVAAAFANRTVSVIGSIDRAQTVSVIGRRDRGIAAVADLKGKRVGVIRGTTTEFFLGRLLDLNGMSLSDITVVDLPRSQIQDAIANGSVDAVVAATTVAAPITTRLGENAVVFPAHSNQPAFGLIVSDRAWTAAHPQETERLLRALAQADEYILANPADAQAIAGRRANMSAETVAAIWPNHQFSLSLDRSLLTAMDDEARWMIANNLTNATAPPEFREYVDTTALGRIDPGAVTIQ